MVTIVQPTAVEHQNEEVLCYRSALRPIVPRMARHKLQPQRSSLNGCVVSL